MEHVNVDRAQLQALGQSEFPFMKAPSFEEAREKAQEMGMEKFRESMCLGTGWAFFGHDANGLAQIVKIYPESTTRTVACPSLIGVQWSNMKRNKTSCKGCTKL